MAMLANQGEVDTDEIRCLEDGIPHPKHIPECHMELEEWGVVGVVSHTPTKDNCRDDHSGWHIDSGGHRDQHRRTCEMSHLIGCRKII